MKDPFSPEPGLDLLFGDVNGGSLLKDVPIIFLKNSAAFFEKKVRITLAIQFFPCITEQFSPCFIKYLPCFELVLKTPVLCLLLHTCQFTFERLLQFVHRFIEIICCCDGERIVTLLVMVIYRKFDLAVFSLLWFDD